MRTRNDEVLSNETMTTGAVKMATAVLLSCSFLLVVVFRVLPDDKMSIDRMRNPYCLHQTVPPFHFVFNMQTSAGNEKFGLVMFLINYQNRKVNNLNAVVLLCSGLKTPFGS